MFDGQVNGSNFLWTFANKKWFTPQRIPNLKANQRMVKYSDWYRQYMKYKLFINLYKTPARAHRSWQENTDDIETNKQYLGVTVTRVDR